MDRKISDIFGYGNDVLFWEECSEFEAEEIKALTLQRLHAPCKSQSRRQARRISRTLLIAAVIASLFTVSAIAVGLSFHSRQQEQLRQALQVEENHVDSYTEFPLPTETNSPDTPSITLISAIKNGEFEEVYVSISPVTKEEIHACAPGDYFFWSVNGGESYGMASTVWDRSKITEADYTSITDPDTGVSFQRVSYEAIERLILENYDEETKSLLLHFSLLCNSPEYDINQPLELIIQSIDMDYENPIPTENGGVVYEGTELVLYGPVPLPPISAECLSIRFPEPVPFENAETGGQGCVTGVELYATGASWIIEHDGMENIYWHGENPPKLSGDALQALQASWLAAIDQVLSHAGIQYSDGSILDLSGGPSAIQYDGNKIKCPRSFPGTIDISQICGVSISGFTMELP